MIIIGIYGEIGTDVRVGDVVKQLQAAKGEPVTLRINSVGGDLMAGFALYNFLKTVPNVTAVVDGVAASIASIVMLGASRVEIPENAWVLIHSVSSKLKGTAQDFEQMADLLAKTDEQLITIYTRETGASPEQVRQWLDGETWFNAADALAAGLVDEVVAPVELSNSLNLSRLPRVPSALQNQLNNPSKPNPIMKSILQVLTDARLVNCSCLSAAAPKEEDIAAELKSALAGLTSERDSLNSKIEALEKEIAGMKASSATTLQARATSAVDAVIAEGRLAPSLRAVMVDAFAKDEAATVKSLAELPKAAAGVAPLLRGTSETAKSLKDRIDAEPDPAKRLQMRVSNYEALAALPA